MVKVNNIYVLNPKNKTMALPTAYIETRLGKLYNANCLDIIKEIPDGSVDMILTDPPYGINFVSCRTGRQEAIVNDGREEWQALMRALLPEFKRVMTDTAVACCFCGGGKDPVTAMFIMDVIKEFKLIQTLVWHKFIGLGWRYRPAYENIVVFSKTDNDYAFYDTSKKCTNVISHIKQDIPRYREIDTGKAYTHISQYRGKEAGKQDEHPTQKPVELMAYLLKIHSKKGDMILEPFAGGGSTLVACEQLGRRWIGAELNAKYCKAAFKKIEAEAAQLKIV